MGASLIFICALVIGVSSDRSTTTAPLANSETRATPTPGRTSARKFSADLAQLERSIGPIETFDLIIPAETIVPNSSPDPYQYTQGNYFKALPASSLTPVSNYAPYTSSTIKLVPLSSTSYPYSGEQHKHPGLSSPFVTSPHSFRTLKYPSSPRSNFRHFQSPKHALHQNNVKLSEIRNYNVDPQFNYFSTFNKPAQDSSQLIPVYPSSNYQAPHYKKAEKYQLLAAQPQLHFHGNLQPIYHSNVQAIDKKRPVLPSQIDVDENSEVYESPLLLHRFVEGNIENEGKPIPKQKSTFAIPDLTIFKSYDEAFGKYSKLTSDAPVVSKAIEKPERYNPSSDKESVKEVYEPESEDPSSKSQEKYQNEDESGSPLGRRPQADPDDDEYTPPKFQSYGQDFDFDESYNSETPVEEYKYEKEVPDFEGSESNEKTSRHAKRDFGVKLPRRGRSKIGDSNEEASEPVPKKIFQEDKSAQSPKRNRVYKSIIGGGPEVAPLNNRKHGQAFAYIHKGGLEVVDPPALGPS